MTGKGLMAAMALLPLLAAAPSEALETGNMVRMLNDLSAPSVKGVAGMQDMLGGTRDLGNAAMPASGISGTWVSADPSVPLMMIFNEQGLASMGYNGQISGYFYNLQGNTLQLTTPDGQHFSLPCTLQGDSLAVTINGIQYQLKRYNQAIPAGPAAPGPSATLPPPPPATAPATQPPQAASSLSGAYTCGVPGASGVSITYNYHGSTYDAVMYNNGAPVISSRGSFGVSGNVYTYTITDSTNKGDVGMQGTATITMNPSGYDLTTPEGLTVKCRRN